VRVMVQFRVLAPKHCGSSCGTSAMQHAHMRTLWRGVRVCTSLPAMPQHMRACACLLCNKRQAASVKPRHCSLFCCPTGIRKKKYKKKSAHLPTLHQGKGRLRARRFIDHRSLRAAPAPLLVQGSQRGGDDVLRAAACPAHPPHPRDKER